MLEHKTITNKFNRLKTLTNNFTSFSPDILMKEDYSLLIFRLGLCFSQKQFGKLLDISNSRVSHFEQRSPVKIRDYEIARNFMNKIEKELAAKNLIGRIDIKDILNTRDLFESKSILDSARAKEIRSKVSDINMLRNAWLSALVKQPKNDFEGEIFDLLKFNNIDFDFHSPIQAKTKVVIPDFLIPSSQDLRIVLEVKQTKSQNIKTEYDILRNYVIVLDHKMHNIKLNHPNVTTIVAISNSMRPLNKLQNGIKAEILDIDNIFIDSNLNELPIYIKNLINFNSNGPVV